MECFLVTFCLSNILEKNDFFVRFSLLKTIKRFIIVDMHIVIIYINIYFWSLDTIKYISRAF